MVCTHVHICYASIKFTRKTTWGINFQNSRVRSADLFFNKTTTTGERYKKLVE